MADSNSPGKPAILIMGFGAAGQAYARGFAPYAHVTASDPYAGAAAGCTELTLCKEMPETLESFDLVIILSPAAVGFSICEEVAKRAGTCPVLDLTSAAPDAMQRAANLLGPRFVDGTVLGAVGLTGLGTPMVFSGPKAADVASLLTPFGCKITCLDGPPGAASTLKLLRSLFMKGLEALVVETNLTAEALGQSSGLELALGDLAEVKVTDLMTEMLRTHPRHAERRMHEVEAATALMQGAGLTPVMSQATLCVFSRTAAGGKGPDASVQQALDWLVSQNAKGIE
ncbi:NAD(P)-dependent oxidoreductase [Pseudorhodobacter aquimaris]|uniref:NAD(P)-dependent oxidoreductase n=1 Tax=Pseudorhodobacter aquimaris TaxID=687412 RepID=UPI00067B981E|nr:NAD(P)-dependent oxidoreductase [Pseudorhodobacter aquimaris]